MPCETLDKFVDCFCPNRPQAFGLPGRELRPDEKPAGVIYRGSAGFGDGFNVERMLPAGFSELDSANNGFRHVWYSATLRAIVTYCEGDVDVTVDRTSDLFCARLASAVEFYKEY